MRFFKTILTAVAVIGLSAGSANALTTVTNVSNAVGEQAQDAFFTVDIIMGFDGAETLNAMFTSTSWDPSELTFISATNAPFAIFFGAFGFLTKIVDPSSFPIDPAGTLRTIQFGANPGQEAGAGPDTLITTLTFQVTGGTDGVANVDVALLVDDTGPFPGGNALFTGASINYTPIPEPGTALLMGLGLAGLGLAGRRIA